jgi:hypothetical protein
MNILHLQIPMKRTGKDNFYVTPEILGKFMRLIRSQLGDEWNVIASPCVPTILSDVDTAYNFNMKQITQKELKEMLHGN